MIETLLAILMLFSYPEKISVRVTGQHRCKNPQAETYREQNAYLFYEVVEVDFQDYVKGVMVNEFGHGHWTYNYDGSRKEFVYQTPEALQAQAIIIKNYALYAYYTGGKWGGYEKGIVYDCDWDMVYDPSITREITDQAVEDSWDKLLLTNNNQIVPTYFNAWSNGCMITHGKKGVCIGQRDQFFKWSDAGWTTEEILEEAYYNSNLVTGSDIWMRIMDCLRLSKIK